VDRAALVLAAKRDPARRQELVDEFGPLIASVARPYRRHGAIDREELMQQGVVGLLDALERYDPALGTPFWAYASWWVRQRIQQMMSELSGPIVLSDRAQRNLSRVAAARRAYLQQHRREPTRTQLAAASELDVSHVEHLMAALGPAEGLDEPVGNGDDTVRFGDLLADPRAEDDFERVQRRTATASLASLLGSLDDRERLVVSRRFGFDGEERTLRDIGADIGLSAERVRQIEQRALERLRTEWHASAELAAV
jgi:RNA polymerase sigma factor (sigma-70 family)